MGWAWEEHWEWLTWAEIQSRRGGDENQSHQHPRSQLPHWFHNLDHKHGKTVLACEKCFVLWTTRVAGDAVAPSRCLSNPLPTLLWRRRHTDPAETGSVEKFLFDKDRGWAEGETPGNKESQCLPYLPQGPAEAISLPRLSGKFSQHDK